jgi:hypothetical protein
LNSRDELEVVSMSLLAKIEMPEKFALTVEGGMLKLPPVRVSPTDPKQIPLRPNLKIEVSGGTSEIAELIGKAYNAEASQFTPKTLVKPHELEPRGLVLNEVLPDGAALVLSAHLTYVVPDLAGRPARSESVEAQCVLQASGDVAAWRETTLDPQRLVLSEGGEEGATLTIRVRTLRELGPTDPASERPGLVKGVFAKVRGRDPKAPSTRPSLRIEDTAAAVLRELPELSRQLRIASDAIQLVPPPPGPEGADGIDVYSMTLKLRLPDPERRRLGDLARSKPLTLPVSVTVAGALPSHLTLEVEALGGQFPGQFAVDFGTSNSTITIYESKEIRPRPLPIDQQEELRHQFEDWFAKPTDRALEGVGEAEFISFVKSVARNLQAAPGEDPVDTVRRRFRPNTSDTEIERMHEAIRQIELSTRGQTDATLRRALRLKLHAIYGEAFRAFPFRQYNLTTLPLDGPELEMCSELEVRATQPKLEVEMGRAVREAREAAFVEASKVAKAALEAETPSASSATPPRAATPETPRPPSGSADPIVEGRFHRVPKRFLPMLNRAERVPVRIVRKSGQKDLVDPAQVVSGAWEHLVRRFDDCRERSPKQYSRGRVRRAVVTYPTVLGPRARGEISRIFRDLGIPTVRTSYDEAVAAAIFHLEKFFGGSYDVGPEAFKTRCRRQSDVWVQNVLVLDIGGGSTDLAMIRIQLSQEPFKDTDQGAGGRYYTITPTLLGSSGNENLGGELITLRTFRLLKLALADYLLAHETALKVPSELVRARGEAKALASPTVPYRSGGLLQRLGADRDDEAFQNALKAAERLVPTRFSGAAEKRALFQAIWREAEEIKVALGRRREPRLGEPDVPLTHTLDAARIVALLEPGWPGIGLPENKESASAPAITLSSEQFELVARPVVESALGIARGLANSSLEMFEKRHPRAAGSVPERLDRIVLSGKSCNLHLVHDLLPRVMRTCSFYGEDVTEVLFEPRLAKQATSVGACRAEEMWSARRTPDGAENTLRKGISLIAFDIRNLFFFLPCSFYLKDLNENLLDKIFEVNERMIQLDDTDLGKVRSRDPEWLQPQVVTRIYRVDYQGDAGSNWGNYYLDNLARDLKLKPERLQEELRVRYEIDHELNIKMLLCKGEPKYSFTGREVWLSEHDVRPALRDALKKSGRPHQVDPLQGDELLFDVGINPIEQTPEAIILPAGTRFSREALEPLPPMEETSRPKDPVAKPAAPLAFALSPRPLPPPTMSRQYEVYARAAGSGNDHWVRLGSLKVPDKDYDFEPNWHITLDKTGLIRLMPGIPPYWAARVPKDLYEFEGSVLLRELESEVRDPDADVDPDSGAH